MAYYISLVIIPLLYLVMLYVLVIRGLPPMTRRTFIVLTGIGLILGAMQALTLDVQLPGFWEWFLDSNAEFSLGTMFSSAQLLAISLLALLVFWRAPLSVWWQRAYWLVFFIFFLYLSVDEAGFFQIHERMNPMVWRMIYSGVGMTLVLGSLLMFWYGFRQAGKPFFLFIIGLFIMGISGVFIEQFVILYICPTDLGPICHKFSLFEEYFEMAGGSLVVTAVLAFAETHLSEANWRLTKPVFALSIAIPTLLTTGNLWVMPAVEAQTLAHPAHVEYLDGDMTLVGYRLSEEVITPGSTLAVSLYWRLNKPVDKEYLWSIRLLTHPEVDTMTYQDWPWTLYPSYAWIPGVIARETVTVKIPDDMFVPQSYWLGLGVWYRPQKPKFISVTQTDHALLSEDMVILGSVPALAMEDVASPPVATNYVFDDGFALVGYDLPETLDADIALTIPFWWDVRADVVGDYVQFVHLVGVADEQLYTFDQQPFGGRFPTQDWPAGAHMVDTWTLPLPEDIEPGDYQVYTGLYTLETVVRLSVTDADGQALPNQIIELGTITIRE